jgi:transketolase
MRRRIQHHEVTCKKVRKTILDMIYKTKSPHIGPSFSIVEILVALYFKYLNTSPDDPLNNKRDRFILSKGHACPALYAVLAERGFLSDEDLNGFAVDGGLLEQHPNRDIQKGIEVSTGSLGHGLSMGVGMALAGKVDKKTYRTFVLLSDGELNEGSVWEAAMFAGHHKLNNIVAIIDCNKIQALGFTKDVIDLEPLSKKWSSFGWSVKEIDGHDLQEIEDTLRTVPFEKDRPSVVIAHTIKGKGVSFMENELLWHYRTPDSNEYQKALEELSE